MSHFSMILFFHSHCQIRNIIYYKILAGRDRQSLNDRIWPSRQSRSLDFQSWQGWSYFKARREARILNAWFLFKTIYITQFPENRNGRVENQNCISPDKHHPYFAYFKPRNFWPSKFLGLVRPWGSTGLYQEKKS